MRPRLLIIFFWVLGAVVSVRGAAGVMEIPLGFEPGFKTRGSLLPYRTVSRPRIALALSGGGARGLAHIGVLQVLERSGIPIDGIAGTSMGAVVGGLYAAGYPASELESIARRIKWSDLIQDRPPRRQLFLSQKDRSARSLIGVRFQDWSPVLRSSITGGHRLNTLLTDLIYNAPQSIDTDFSRLKIPLCIVATDLLTGRKILLTEGSLGGAMRGSMAIPLMFAPVAYGSWYLADGGLVQNLPVEEARRFEPDLVIAVDTSSKLRPKSELNVPWQLADQVTTIMHKDILDSQLAAADLAIQPELDGIDNTDFDKIDAVIQAGREAAQARIQEIESMIMELDRPVSTGRVDVDGVRFTGLNRISSDALSDLIQLDPSAPVPVQDIVWTAHMLYQSGDFQTVSAFLDTVRRALVFDCVENPAIEEIRIQGNTHIPDHDILSLMDWTPGRIMNHAQARKNYANITSHYLEKGYALFRILNTEIQDGVMTIEVDEGRIHHIELDGNRRTRSSVIYRDLSLKPGDLFNIHDVTRSLDNLYSTRLFDDVHFDIRGSVGDRTLIFHFIERPYNLLRFGLRYDLERQTKGFLEFVEENVFGLGGQASVTALYGSWDRMLQGQIQSDRLFNTLWTAELNAGLEQRRFRYYEHYKQSSIYRLSRGFASFSIGQQMQKLGTLWGRLDAETYETVRVRGGAFPAEDNVLTTLSLRSVVDTRDAMPFPGSGKYYVLEYQSSLMFLGSEVPYFRLYSSMSSYYPVTKRIVFMPRLRWGTADLTIPFLKQFRLGGLDSFCGLPEGGAVGKRFISVNTALRYRIPWIPWFSQYLTVRYDLGGIWARYAKISTSDFVSGAGAFWSANTPLGPLHLGWGRLSTGQTRWYFSLGHAFE